jgi:hypothetical protein
MSLYNITKYSYDQAKKLGVNIKPSSNPKKKIDVFDKNNNKLASIGDVSYKDFPTYMKEKGQEYANYRRRLYHLRHKDNKKGTANYFSKEILW